MVMLSWARQQNHVLPVAVGMLGFFLTLYAVVNHGWSLEQSLHRPHRFFSI